MRTIRSFKNSILFGTLLLTFTGILSRLIDFYYKIFLSRAIGAEELGIFHLIFPVFSLLLSVSAMGIQAAISRYCAQSGTDRQARGYLYAGLILSLSLSLLCMGAVQRCAGWLAASLLAESRCTALLRVMSRALPFACVHACIEGYCFGRRRTVPPAFSQLIEPLIRITAVYLFSRIALEQHTELTARTAAWGFFIGEFVSALYMIFILLLARDSDGQSIRLQKKLFRQLLSFAAPLSLNGILMSLLQSGEAILIPLQLRAFGYTSAGALSEYGILTGMAFSTIMFPAVLSQSLSVMLMPAVAKACAADRRDLVRRTVSNTVEASLILGLSCTLLFLLTGSRIGANLFHNARAGDYIETLSWICPFIFLSGTLGSILHGLGKTVTSLLINLFGSLLRIGFVLLGIPLAGMNAYLWGILASQTGTALCAYLCIRKACT